MEKPTPIIPPLFMSANWYSEKQMVELFVAGLNNGVRGFDTAREYGVESRVSRALLTAMSEVGIKRDEVFIQTRISNEEIIKGHIYDEVCRSLEKMRLVYLDSFMFHWPTPDYYLSAWKQLETVYMKTDLLKSIGMCNCRMRHLKQMEDSVSMMPQVLQVEVQPLWQANDVVDYCRERHIAIQAFSPLCKMTEQVASNPVLNHIAENHQVSVAQIVLKWHVQRGISPISLTSKVSRVKSNFDLSSFSLSDDEMEEIAGLDCGYKYHLESATCVGF